MKVLSKWCTVKDGKLLKHKIPSPSFLPLIRVLPKRTAVKLLPGGKAGFQGIHGHCQKMYNDLMKFQ